jgi:hypothetical protein
MPPQFPTVIGPKGNTGPGFDRGAIFHDFTIISVMPRAARLTQTRRLWGRVNRSDTIMKDVIRYLAPVVACAILALPRIADAQSPTQIPPSITTPDKVDSRLGTLEFKDGAPSKATLDKV